MLKKLFIVTVFALSFVFFASAQTVQELIQQADNHAEKEFNNSKALEKLKAAEQKEPNNFEILWRLSRTYVDIGEHTSGEDKQMQQYNQAKVYADKAISAAPNKSLGYLRRAIVNGRIALFKGVFSVGGVVNQVKKDVEKAIQFGNGGNEVKASAHYVLGRTHSTVSDKPYLVRAPLGLGWAELDTAIEELKKAAQLRPNFRMIRLELAKAYIKDDQYSAAREQLQKISSLPKLDEDDDKVLQEATKLLTEIKNK